MALVVNNNGNVITEEANKEDKTWEGGVQQENKKENLIFSLTTLEKLELKTFEQNNAKNIGEGMRREMFRQHAARELLQMREENDRRTQEGKEPISKEDRRIDLRNGVVKSLWRAKAENATMRENSISEIARFNEDCRS